MITPRRNFILGICLALVIGVLAVHLAQAVETQEFRFTPSVSIPGLFPADGQASEPIDQTIAGRYVRALYIYFIGIVGVLAVVMIMYAGILWITAAGNASKISQAKEHMNGAVIGVILILTSYLLLTLINPQLVTLRVPYINPVETITQSTIWCTDQVDQTIIDKGTDTQYQCGTRYTVNEPTSPGQSKFQCIGHICDNNKDGVPDTDSFCAPRGGGSYECINPEEACESIPKGNRASDWCPFIDKLLAQIKPDYGCAFRKDKFLGIDEAKNDDCYYSPIIKSCQPNEMRVDCNYGLTADQTETRCWDGKGPRSYSVPPVTSKCQSLGNTRPVRKINAICCAGEAKANIYCAATINPKISFVKTDCAPYNAQPGTFAGGETTCTTNCWRPLSFRWGEAEDEFST